MKLDPSVGCELLADEGLGSRGGYRPNGDYECRSRRRPLISGGQVNNTIRFVARGTSDHVQRISIELQVNSLRMVQRAHRELVNAAQTAFQSAIGQPLPTETETAILSAVPGQWTVGGCEITLQRIVLGGPGYELRLRLE